MESPSSLLSYRWEHEGGALVVEAIAALPAQSDMSESWVWTFICRRFKEGIFAWQLHWSTELDHVLVLPNDFLTARQFSTSQLNILVDHPAPGKLILTIPSGGPIPGLVREGDQLEVHALWIQQTPLFRLTLEDSATPVALGETEGGGGNLRVPVTEDWLPARNIVEIGDTISHQFTLPPTQVTPSSPRRVFTYTLLRIYEGRPDEFVRFGSVQYDSSSQIYHYHIPTEKLTPGDYRLIIDASNPPISQSTILEMAFP